MNNGTLNHQVEPDKQEKFSYRRAYILFGLLGFCTLFYYFGELVNFAGWKALQLSFFYSIHDTHRLLFLAPILYAGYFFSGKAVIIVSIITATVFIPRALLFSPYPDPVLRAETFAVIAGAIGYLTAVTRAKTRRISHLETTVRRERDKLLEILERMADGVLITGPDFKVRFTNTSLKKEFGEGAGSYCYHYLHRSDKPCTDCRLPEILNGAAKRWDYHYPNGKTYELQASPYIDSDGVTCQLATFRNITAGR